LGVNGRVERTLLLHIATHESQTAQLIPDEIAGLQIISLLESLIDVAIGIDGIVFPEIATLPAGVDQLLDDLVNLGGAVALDGLVDQVASLDIGLFGGFGIYRSTTRCGILHGRPLIAPVGIVGQGGCGQQYNCQQASSYSHGGDLKRIDKYIGFRGQL